MNYHNGDLSEYGAITPPPTGGSMLENKYLVVVPGVNDTLNVRSAPEKSYTTDLGAFNLSSSDIIHAIESQITAGVKYYRFDALYRNSTLVPFPASPTGQYWVAEAQSTTSTTKWLVPSTFIPPVPPPPIVTRTVTVTVSETGWTDGIATAVQNKL
jgi:hypothetical protein